MNKTDARVKLLQDTAFFGGIEEEIITFILEASATVEIGEGKSFFLEAASAKAMYIIEAGQVAVLKNKAGKDYLLRKLESGDCFGEMALMDFKARSASVYALEGSCKAIEITPHTLHKVFALNLEQFAIIQMNMGREVCRRLRATDNQVFEQTVTAEIKGDHVAFSCI